MSTLPTPTLAQQYPGGFRIDRAGSVFAVQRIHHGRPSGKQLHIGQVWRDGRTWRNDQTSTTYKTQDNAASSLYRIVIGA